MRWLLGLVASLALAAQAVAGTFTATWTAPTQNTDGTAITLPLTYELRYGACAGVAPYTMGTVTNTVTQPGVAYTSPNLPAGLVCVDVAAIAGGQLSARTPVGSKLMPAAVPNPPGGLTLTVVGTVAYKQRIGGTPDKPVVTYVPLGTVAPGTVCVAGVSANGYNAIPRSAMTPNNRHETLPFVVYSICG